MIDYLNKHKNYLVLAFTIVYLLAFTLNGVSKADYEFLYYTILITVVIIVVMTIHQNLHLASFILVNLSMLGFIHLMGGNMYIEGVRLYDIYFIPGIIRYDNIVHTYGTFIGTLSLYSLLAMYIDPAIRRRYPIFAILLILMAIGMGTVVELVEFLAVVLFGVTDKVGDYFNNTLDLFFNTLGASLATVVIYFYLYPPNFIKRINVQTREGN